MLVVGGSRAYGIHTAGSDVDVKGCCVPPAAVFHGFLHKFEQVDDAGGMDVFADLLNPEETAAAAEDGLEGTVYDVRKLLALAVQSNPNILDVLFCRDAEVRLVHPLGERLRAHRDLFLSARARDTFTGYAAAQLKRIRTHRAWLLNPPAGRPSRGDFGLPETPLVRRDQRMAVEAALRGEEERGASFEAGAQRLGLDDNLIEALKRERSFHAARQAYRNYQQWLKGRNPRRAALEAKYGYDTKHGAHLVRLLRMGVEVLTTGKVNVWRGPGGPDDAAELVAIRGGAWSYDELVTWADTQNRALTEIVAAGGSVLPDQPDREAVDRLCVEVVEAALGGGLPG